MSGASRKRIKYSEPLLPLQHICKFVDLHDLYSMRLVSHRWCRHVSKSAIWEPHVKHVSSWLKQIPFTYDPWTQIAQILFLGKIEPKQLCRYFI